MFDLSTFEILIISLFFITALDCTLTYFCCSKVLKILEIDKSINKAINKIRVFDQYLLSKINLIIALFYFGVSYFLIDDLIQGSEYVFFFSCALSFVLTLVTTFISRLCYCYTCNVLLETKLNELDCLIVNFKRLITIYLPFLVVSLLISLIYSFGLSLVIRNVICIISLAFVLIFWIILAPKLMILNLKAKKINKNSLLRHRLEQLIKLHGINKFELYYWDTSRSKESNAMVSGVKKIHLFVSSSLLEDVTLPELETVVTHEIGHIKNNHLIKIMIGKFFVAFSVMFMVFCPYIFKFDEFSKVLFYILTILFVGLEFLIAAGVERNYENEADAYAARYNDPVLFASALKKIIKYEEDTNKIDDLFQSHSNLKVRIENVKKESDKKL